MVKIALAWSAAVVLLFPGIGPAQIEEHDLDVEESVVPPEIERTHEQALALFATAEQSDSVPLFTQVIDTLRPLAAGGDEKVGQLLVSSLLRRAIANFNFGGAEAARTDLRDLIQLDPSYDIPRADLSTRFAALWESTRKNLIGNLTMVISPQDASAALDGKAVAADVTGVPLLTGQHQLKVTRPGYQAQELGLEIKAGETAVAEVALERTSSTIELAVEPSAGVEVLLDGRARAVLSDDTKGATWLEGIDAGAHDLELRKTGYRRQRIRVEVPALSDVRLGRLTLEREAGTLVLRGVTAAAEITLDKRAVRPQFGADGKATLGVPPGSYLLSVSHGSFGRFESTVDIADKATVDVQVVLRPAVVLAGVLGGDDVAAEKLRKSMQRLFDGGGAWTFLDRGDQLRSTLSELDLDAGKLRRIEKIRNRRAIDWTAVQARVDREVQGSVIVLAVLADDLLASEATLWIWPAAPAPALVETRTVEIASEESLQGVVRGFYPSLPAQRPTLGAILVDSPNAPGPLVVHVSAGSPAESGGLQVGDALTSVGGQPVSSAAQFEQLLLRLEPGEATTLRLSRANQELEVPIQVGRSWQIVDTTDSSLIAPSLLIAVAAELQRESRLPRWLLQANYAALLLRMGDAEAAVRELRRIDTTSVPAKAGGLGRATIDYFLGMALTAAGPRYTDPAREAFSRVAQAPDGRLLHDDGPLLRPRALARLERLGGAP